MRTRVRKRARGERGAITLEFALTASIYFTFLFAVSAVAVYHWAHNGLVEATRRGARYAATVGADGANASVRSMAVYGNTGGAGQSVAPQLTTANIAVRHSADFGVGAGTVYVAICTEATKTTADEDGDCTPYTYDFVIPGVSLAGIAMPSYQTAAAGESAGYAP